MENITIGITEHENYSRWRFRVDPRTDVLGNLSLGRDNLFYNGVAGEARYHRKAGDRYPHCDLRIWWKNIDHWVEVKTIMHGDNLNIQRYRIQDDIAKRKKLENGRVFHELVIAYPVPVGEEG